MNTKSRLFLAASILSAVCVNANAVTVPGTSDMWLAGMPNGSTASSGDSAPTNSPVLISNFDAGAEFITFINVTGSVSYGPGCSNGCGTPDGSTFWSHSPGSINGLSDVIAPINSLMGVFLDDTQPNLSAAPEKLNFQTLGLNFLELAPKLKQIFFIGDGLTGNNTGDIQKFFVPDGATRLYLGTMDGYGWYNNSGKIEVGVSQVPLPAPLWLFSSALLGVLGFRRRAI